MKKNLLFRAWYYFRMGWGTYFAFIFAAINTLVVTYYLAIENIPFLKEVFPSFGHYILIVISIGLPLLVIVGYIHFKKSAAYKAEADISFESHPHLKRILQNTELVLPLYLKMSQIIVKLSKNEKIADNEIDEVTKLQDQLFKHIGKRTLGEYESNVYDQKNEYEN